MPSRLGSDHMLRDRIPRSNTDLLFDQFTAHHLLGHRMLYLNPGIHLHEIEISSIGIHQILNRACIPVFNGFDQADRGNSHPLAKLFGNQRTWTLLDDLLVASLH